MQFFCKNNENNLVYAKNILIFAEKTEYLCKISEFCVVCGNIARWSRW